MKDYTLNNEDRKMFILNYKIKKDNIIVKLASGEKYIVPYSIENEQKILERMKEQVTKNIDFERKAIKEYCILTIITTLLTVATFIIAGKNIPSLISNPTIKTFLTNIPTFIAATLTAFSSILSLNAKEILEDFRKNKLYLEKEEEINQKVTENENMLSKVSNKTKKMVISTPAEQTVFDINKMDKVTLKDLKQLLENFKRDEEFNFDYEPKKLIRKND